MGGSFALNPVRGAGLGGDRERPLIILLIIFLNDASPACFAIRAAFSTVNS